jgi:hypothetical protein
MRQQAYCDRLAGGGVASAASPSVQSSSAARFFGRYHVTDRAVVDRCARIAFPGSLTRAPRLQFERPCGAAFRPLRPAISTVLVPTVFLAYWRT